MSESSRTNRLIETLANDSAHSAEANRARARGLRLGSFLGFWAAGAALIVGLSFWLLPVRPDLAAKLHGFELPVLALLWSAATLLSALKVYTLSFPDGEATAAVKRLASLAPAAFAILGLAAFIHLNLNDFAFQLSRESSYLNGGCGMVIAVAGSLHAAFLFSWIRRGAPASPMRAGAWAAVSTASFASFVVQFACPNENPIHIVLWHFIPLLALTAVAALTARRLLRW